MPVIWYSPSELTTLLVLVPLFTLVIFWCWLANTGSPQPGNHLQHLHYVWSKFLLRVITKCVTITWAQYICTMTAPCCSIAVTLGTSTQGCSNGSKHTRISDFEPVCSSPKCESLVFMLKESIFKKSVLRFWQVMNSLEKCDWSLFRECTWSRPFDGSNLDAHLKRGNWFFDIRSKIDVSLLSNFYEQTQDVSSHLSVLFLWLFHLCWISNIFSFKDT